MKENDINNPIGCYLRNFLDNKGISQKQVQDDLHVSQQYVSAIIRGKKSIGKKTAKRLSELYGLDEYFLITGIENGINANRMENYKSIDEVVPVLKETDLDFKNLPIEEKLNMIYLQNIEIKNQNIEIKEAIALNKEAAEMNREKMNDMMFVFHSHMQSIINFWKMEEKKPKKQKINEILQKNQLEHI